LMTDSETSKENKTIKNTLAETRKRLKGFSDSYQNDSRVILAHVLNKSQIWLLAHSEEELTPEQISQLNEYIIQLESGTPLPFVLGEWEFFGLKFKVTPQTLIPRPETELLVETALNWIQENPNKSIALDIGTGTGCIPISIAVHKPLVKFTAADISSDALKIAQENAQQHGVQDRVSFESSNLYENIDSKFDLICSNPPYIPTDVLRGVDVYKKEPTLALDGGVDGLSIIRTIIEKAAKYLLPKGMLLIEIEASQGDAVKKIATKSFTSTDIHVKKDLAGHDRLLVIQT